MYSVTITIDIIDYVGFHPETVFGWGGRGHGTFTYSNPHKTLILNFVVFR